MSENKLRRRPTIYLAGSCSSKIVDNIKLRIKGTEYAGPVEFIDPKEIMPKRDNYINVAAVNNSAISQCDLMVCIMVNQTAGAAIELYICVALNRKPAMIATGVPADKMTPRIRQLTDAIYEIENIVDIISVWVTNWYEGKV